jgi:hypothetical protein
MSTSTESERVSSKSHAEIIREAHRIGESALYSAKGHFNSAEIWGWFHYALGLTTVALAAIAGAKALSKIDADGNITAILSITVAVLSGVTTFLNPNKAKSDHLTAGNQYLAIVNKARIFRAIECWGESSDQTLTAKLIKLSEEQAALNKASPQISIVAYWLAKRGIARGEGQFAVDEKPGDDKPAGGRPV